MYFLAHLGGDVGKVLYSKSICYASGNNFYLGCIVGLALHASRLYRGDQPQPFHQDVA